MGTVRFNKQRGKFMLDYLSAEGRRVREVYGPTTTKTDRDTRRLAVQVLKQREGDAAAGKNHLLPAERVRFRDYATDWLERRKQRVRQTTYSSYHAAVTTHLVPAPEFDLYLDGLTRRHVEDFLKRAGSEGMNQASTINHTLRVLKTVLGDAVTDDLLTKNPAASVRPLREEPDAEESEVRALNAEQISRLLAVAEEPWRTLFTFALGTGMRRNEVLGLQWRDLDLDASPPMVYVRKQLGLMDKRGQRVELKTGSSSRDLDIPQPLAEALRNLPRGDDPDRDFVFLSRRGNPVDTASLRTAFLRCLTLASLPAVSFHCLRHTHASLLFEAGVDLKTIQYRLGHSSIAITADVYSHFLRPERRHVGHIVSPALFGNGTATETGKVTIAALEEAISR